jgi:ribosomal protein L37AE/L43A
MKIDRIESQHRRDFTAIYVCEHCGVTIRGRGYDDDNFHRNVVPKMHCPVCEKQSPDDYQPLTTKYPEGFQI